MEPGNTEHYLEQLNLTELMEQLNRCFSSAFLADFSLEQLFSDILSGNGKEALQLLGRQIAGSVGQEFSGMRQILSVLLLLGILSVLVSCLMGSFENQQVAQIAHALALIRNRMFDGKLDADRIAVIEDGTVTACVCG